MLGRRTVGSGLRRDGRVRVHGARELEDLVGDVEQLAILIVLLLNRLPLRVGDDLPFGVGSVLADHHERREEDRLQGSTPRTR